MDNDNTPLWHEDIELSDVDMCDALPKYNGWSASYDFPGYIWYSHPDTNVIITLCSDFNGDGHLDIQVQTNEGDQVDEPYDVLDGSPEWPHGEYRTAERMFELVKPFLDKYQPRSPTELQWIEKVKG